MLRTVERLLEVTPSIPLTRPPLEHIAEVGSCGVPCFSDERVRDRYRIIRDRCVRDDSRCFLNAHMESACAIRLLGNSSDVDDDRSVRCDLLQIRVVPWRLRDPLHVLRLAQRATNEDRAINALSTRQPSQFAELRS